MAASNTNRPPLFEPTVNTVLRYGSANTTTFQSIEAGKTTDISVGETGSFKYSVPEEGLKSTQELNIDWSDFANHTFFNSAQVKVNVAYDKIQNQFPFDGTNKEVEIYLDSLTGYEKYVLDNYPKNTGYLYLSGTRGETSGGTFVVVKDIAGAAYPYSSRRSDGTYVMSPEDNSMTIEYWVWVPGITNDNQVILDKHSGSMGWMVSLDTAGSTTTATTTFRIISGSVTSNLTTTFPKNEWSHLAWVWDRTPGEQKINSYLNGVFQVSSSQQTEFGTIEARGDFLIGSGSTLDSFVPDNTLSGALDELRIWHSIRTQTEIKEHLKKNVFASTALKAYYRFNEASGSGTSLVIDASSNSLHGKLSAAAVSTTLLNVRQVPTSSVAGVAPMSYERTIYNPILFPQHPLVVSDRTTLLASASVYDDGNPNIITRLVPRHYFLEGQSEEGLSTEEGQILTDLTTGTDPRSTKLGATQVLLLLLYTWAKYFDEMKLFTQAFADLPFVDYDNTDTVPSQFLQRLAKSQGIELPPLFTGASVSQFIYGNNVGVDIGINQSSLQYVQNQIWRRILINLRDIVESKGTLHSIKSLIRAIGIDPDNNFRIREYGGPTKRNLSFLRDTRNEVSTMLNFMSGGIIEGAYLSASRVEAGAPGMSGTFVGGVSNVPADGLFTSGSWTFEGTYKLPKNRSYNISQSLVRLCTTGSANNADVLLLNCVACSGSTTGSKSVTIIANPNSSSIGLTTPLILSVTGADLFTGDQWYVSFGRQRNDQIGNGAVSLVSSSYFLRVARQGFGTIEESYVTASYFDDKQPSSSGSMFATSSIQHNASGAFIQIGSQSIQTTTNMFLNSTNAVVPQIARASAFTGNVSQIRFWTKYLEDKEWLEHARDFKSVGVQDPLTNFNFVTSASGSWERLRIDASTDQQITMSTATGGIDIFDFSQNNLHLSGTSFPWTASVIVPERYYYSFVSPRIDDGSTTEKVRVRSFLDADNVSGTPWAQFAPVYDITPSELPTDNTKFTIDFSIVDTLNQDIITIFSTLDSLDNQIGNPELIYSADYPGLDNLRTVYFNKLTDKMNLKNFFEFFKWFDTNIGSFLSQLIPRKTKFLGTNFLVESHMLERPKVLYNSEDMYLGDSNRDSQKETLKIENISSTIKRL